MDFGHLLSAYTDILSFYLPSLTNWGGGIVKETSSSCAQKFIQKRHTETDVSKNMPRNIYSPLKSVWYLGNCFGLLRVKDEISISFPKLWVLGFSLKFWQYPVTSECGTGLHNLYRAPAHTQQHPWLLKGKQSQLKALAGYLNNIF